ncbi:MAG: sporulation protein YqfD [Bacilli bacterium]|nr:sporulation protein YqfD [Bacilli bacterium]
MNKVRIIVYEDNIYFNKYLYNNKISYSNLEKDKYYIFDTTYDSYIKISRRYKCEVIKYYGVNGFVLLLKKNKFFIISFFFSMFLLVILTNTIFEVRINLESEYKDYIYSELQKVNLSKYKRVKSETEINEIKESILNKNNDLIQWIEITRKGCTYIIDVTLKVINEEEILEDEPCNIVASKDGVIRKIISNKGSKVKEINDYVKKGDVLISGLIYKGDDISNIVHASGRVYAETWYTVNISVPYDYVEYMETGNYFNRYYISLFDKEFTISGKYEYKDGFRESYLIFEKPYLFFKLYKEINKEYKYISHKLSEREAYEIALKRSEEKIVNTLSSDEYVISKKVLKKEVKSSKIVLEVFFKVYEEIGETSNIENLGEINGSGNQRSN